LTYHKLCFMALTQANQFGRFLMQKYISVVVVCMFVYCISFLFNLPTDAQMSTAVFFLRFSVA